MPFEMITMLGSTVLGGVMSIWSQSIKAKQAEQKMLLQRAEVQQKGFKEAREYDVVVGRSVQLEEITDLASYAAEDVALMKKLQSNGLVDRVQKNVLKPIKKNKQQ